MQLAFPQGGRQLGTRMGVLIATLPARDPCRQAIVKLCFKADCLQDILFPKGARPKGCA